MLKSHSQINKIFLSRKYEIICCFLLIFTITAPPAMGQKVPLNWPDSKNLLGNFNEEESCNRTWDILWEWSKKGNAEARSLLFISLTPPPDMTVMTVPGTTSNYVSRLRDILILAVYAEKYLKNSNLYNDYKPEIDRLYITAGFDQFPSGRKFLQCREGSNKECESMAIKSHLIPSFEEYSEEIDAHIAAGKEPKCEYTKIR